MMKRRLFGLAFGLIAAVAFGILFQGQRMPAQQSEAKAQVKDAPGKGRRAQEFIAAFNKGDAKAVAGFWTATGEYTFSLPGPRR
jgi:hypothetical protein